MKTTIKEVTGGMLLFRDAVPSSTIFLSSPLARGLAVERGWVAIKGVRLL